MDAHHAAPLYMICDVSVNLRKIQILAETKQFPIGFKKKKGAVSTGGCHVSKKTYLTVLNSLSLLEHNFFYDVCEEGLMILVFMYRPVIKLV